MENGDPDVKRPRLDPLHSSGHPAPIAHPPPPPPSSASRPDSVANNHPPPLHPSQHTAHPYHPPPGQHQHLPPPAHPHQHAQQPPAHHPPHPQHNSSGFREPGHTTAQLEPRPQLPDPHLLPGYQNRNGYGQTVNHQPSSTRSHSFDGSFPRHPTSSQPPSQEAQRRPGSTLGIHEGNHTSMDNGHPAPMYHHPDQVHGLPQQHPPPGYPVHHPHEAYPSGPVGPPHYGGPMNYQHSPFAQSVGFGTTKRKQVRAVQACNACRARKQKCDEARPCSFCNENGIPCEYREIPPQKQDRSVLALLEKLDEVSHTIRSEMNVMSSRIGHIESGLSKVVPEFKHVTPLVMTPAEIRDVSTTTTPAEAPKAPTRSSEQSEGPTLARTTSQTLANTAFDHPQLTEAIEMDMSTSISNREKSHTTAAHRLLDLWPCMDSFKDPNTYRSDYAFFLERERGNLRPFGRGEGVDVGAPSAPNRPGHVTMANSPSEEPNSPAPSPPEGVWGTLATGPIPGIDGKRADQANLGGANPDGSLNVEEHVVRRLFASYLNSMHRLHPFISENKLNRMMEDFITKYSPTSSGTRFAVPRNPVDTYGGLPQKRKLSNGITFSTPAHVTGFDQPHSKPVPEKSMSNAIVLLVLALGRICEHKDPLPGPATPQPVQYFGTSPMTEHTEISPMPIKQSPQSSSPPMSITSPGTEVTRITHRSGRSSVEPYAIDRSGPKNVDKIPGLAYYACASEILGTILNGYTLSHVQAFLLAGLYHGQLCRALESWGWIEKACKAWLVLVAGIPKSTLVGRAKDSQQDMINFAFWTCLQLESDIHAELSELPLTGISAYEFEVHFPVGVAETLQEDGLTLQENPANPDMFFYSAQIMLRTTLNKVHVGLYTEKKSERRALHDLENYYEMIEAWRTYLPDNIKWNDEEEPAKDINVARLRAKYYGCRYIISRPVLMSVVHHDSLESSYKESTKEEDNNLREQSWYKHCKLCVDSAKKSTVAFDNVDDFPNRLVVTGVWGTAHAQFGNMLVLCAVYKCNNPMLRGLVEQEELGRLMKRTIDFLDKLAPLSPVMKQDASILRFAWSQIQPRQTSQNYPARLSQHSSFGP